MISISSPTLPMIDTGVRKTKAFRLLYHRLHAPYGSQSPKADAYKEFSVYLLCMAGTMDHDDLVTSRENRDWGTFNDSDPLRKREIQYQEITDFLRKQGQDITLTYERLEFVHDKLKKS